MNPDHEDCSNYRSRKICSQEPIRTSIRRFYLALDGYLESSNPVQTGDEILSIVCASFDAALFFKRLKIKSFLETKKLVLLELPDWYNKHPWYPLKDIGDVFNYSYVPHFKEETEDFLFGQMPITQDEKILNAFREKVEFILPEEFEFRYVDPREVLLRTTSSSQLIPGMDGKTIENWKVKSQFMSFSSDSLRGKRAVIQVSPEGVRDTVILPIDTVNSVTYIERQVHEIIQAIPGNGMIDNPAEIVHKCDLLRRRHSTFLCRDFEKEGITKPRNLIRIVLESIVKKYPQLSLMKELIGIYDAYVLNVDGVDIPMVRGHGLGMANSLTTLIQIAIFNLTLDLMEPGDLVLDDEPECLAYNDDFVAGFRTESNLEGYWELEGEVLEGLGLRRKPQKSFKGDDFVFCEIYGPSLCRKESFLRREVLNTLSCANIVHAKEVFSQACEFNEFVVSDYEEEIISYWGYEFTPKEVNLPYRFGGWKTTTYKGIDLCLEGTSSSDVHLKALYEASKHRIQRGFQRGSSKIEFVNPIQKMFRISTEEIPKEYRSKLNIGTERSVSQNFIRNSLNPDHLAFLYRECERKRKNVYGVELNKPQMPCIYFRRLVMDENPEVAFFDRTSGGRINFYQTREIRRIERAWDTPNPTMSFIKSLFPERIPEHRIDANPLTFLLGNPSKMKKELSNREMFLIERDLSNLKIECKALFEVEKYRFKFDDESSVRAHFFDPQLAAELAMLLGMNYIPIPDYQSPGRKELIDLCNGLYKRDIDREKQIPSVLDFRDFQELMNIEDEMEFQFQNSLVLEAFRSTFTKVEPVEVKKEKIPSPKKERKIKTRKDLSYPDLYWGWKSDPNSHIVPHEMEVVDETLLLLSGNATDRVEEILEIQEIPPFWWNFYIKLIGFECTKVGAYQIPNYILNVTSGFSDDEDQYVGSFFD